MKGATGPGVKCTGRAWWGGEAGGCGLGVEGTGRAVSDSSPSPPPPSQGCAIMESLRQMVERAVAPVLEELKQREGTRTSCPSCQRLHSKILVV